MFACTKFDLVHRVYHNGDVMGYIIMGMRGLRFGRKHGEDVDFIEL